jgi:hypothetical protein
MRKIIVHVQSTLNGCIANTQGTFWQPFPWGDAEHAALQDLKGPAVLAAGPQLFGHLSHDLALELVNVTAFDGGVVVLRHGVMQPSA